MSYTLIIVFCAVSICAGVHVNLNIASNSGVFTNDESFANNASALSTTRVGQNDGASEPIENGSFGLQATEQNRKEKSKILQRNEQEHQNQEFENYIRNFHSGPTVETVYESAIPAQQRQSDQVQPERSNNVSPNVQSYDKFERQIAAVNDARSSENLYQIKHIHETPPNMPYNQNFDVSQYEAGKESAPNVNFHTQYPEQVPEVSNIYGEYYGYPAHPSTYDTMNSREYLPPHYHRPVVTKTIQIAQPALKAKKFEIRHPAIQKEFYDIEERVVIKPAGTIVVELERPVAKIPKGESILPLGHPHPAVASAYNNEHGVTQTQFTSDTFTNTIAPPVYEPKPTISSTTIASAITSQTLGNAANDDLIAANLNRQPNVENKHVPITPVEAKGNYDGVQSHKVSTQQEQSEMINSHNAYYTRDDTDSSKAVKTQSNIENNPVATITATANKFSYLSHVNLNNRSSTAQNPYESEYFTNGANVNMNNYRSARIQVQPTADPIRKINANVQKYEPNIVIPPSQHNIYISPTRITTFNDTIGPVPGIKQYLQSHKEPFVVYAISTRDLPPVQQTNARSTFGQNHPNHQYIEDERVNKHQPNNDMQSNEKSNMPLEQSSNNVNPKNVEFSEISPHDRLKIHIPQAEKVNQLVTTSMTTQTSPDQHSNIYVEPFVPPQEYSNQNEEGNKNFKSDCYEKNKFVETSSSENESKFQRIIEQPPKTKKGNDQHVLTNLKAEKADVEIKTRSDHIQPGSRVIAATPAPTGAASESFHKRRIVVNHPFQTVREVVEHEPITNYHQVQVNEPSSPALYQSAYYHNKQGEHHNSHI